MIELDSTEKEETPADRIPVFSIDGTVYDMPAEIKPHVALKYLWMLRQNNADYASAWLMETVLGKEGFEALSNFEGLTPKQFNAIRDIVQEKAMGATEDPGKAQTKDRYSGNARKKSPGRRTTSKT